MIRTLFFDVDGTLMDFIAAERAAFCETAHSMDIEDAEQRYPRYSAVNKSFWESLERGEITREQLLASRYRVFLEQEGLSADPVEFERRYRANLEAQHHLMEQTEEVLAHYFGKYPMYVVTNGIATTQHRRLKDSGIERYFEKVFISEELGCDKPSMEFFEKCFAAAQIEDPAEVLIIGDSLSSDILGGERAGLKTCWYNPSGKPLPASPRVDHMITRLKDLYAIV